MCTELLVLVYSFFIRSKSRKNLSTTDTLIIKNSSDIVSVSCPYSHFRLVINVHSSAPCWTLIHLVFSCRSSTRARTRGRGKATFSFKPLFVLEGDCSGLFSSQAGPTSSLLKQGSQKATCTLYACAMMPWPPSFQTHSSAPWMLYYDCGDRQGKWSRSHGLCLCLVDGRDGCVPLLFPLILTLLF